jgi:hypothetical protein
MFLLRGMVERTIIMIFMTLFLGGSAAAAIKIPAKLLIPTAAGQKPYKAVITITRAVVRIDCEKKIFQPFNLDTPRQQQLNINASDLVRIEIDEKEKKIYLRVENSFVDKYRNLFNLESRFVGFDIASYGHLYREFWAIIFSYEKSLDIGCLDKEILNSINSRVYPVYTKHYFFGTRN